MEKDKNSNLVKCPSCGHEFSIESIMKLELTKTLKAEIEVGVRKKEQELKQQEEKLNLQQAEQDKLISLKVEEKQKELEKTMKLKMEADFENRLKALQEQNNDKQKQIKELSQRESELLKREQSLKEKAENASMELEKTLLTETIKIKEEADKKALEKAELMIQKKEQELKEKTEDIDMIVQRKTNEEISKVRTQEQMKQAELQKQLDDNKKLIDEMKRKSEQGSMQTQGEVQELELESLLQKLYPMDIIEPVGKGVKGADCIQTIRNNFGMECGRIVYESKRTKAFAGDWTDKLKANMLTSKADTAILVTQVLPTGMTRFGKYEGVLVCTFEDVQALSLLLREQLMAISIAVATQENKGDKMVLLYKFLTGNEFRQQVEAIVEGFSCMKENLDREKKAMSKIWAEREKQIEKVIINTVHMYGNVKGIAGSAVQEIKQLELPAMEDKNNDELF